MANYWIKFYTEVLDDPKVATLPDKLWRRFYELCLIACKEDRNGYLPSIEDIAWTLRQPEDVINKDIAELEHRGLVTWDDGAREMLVRNYGKRQVSKSDAERQKLSRENKRKEEYQNKPVTSCDSNVSHDNKKDVTTCDTELELELELEKNRVDVDVPPDGGNNDIPITDSKRITNFAEMAKIDLSMITFDSRDVRAWLTDLDRMRASGVTEPIMRQAIAELTEKKYKITGPQSIVKACDVIMGERKRKDQANIRIPDSAGVVRWFFQALDSSEYAVMIVDTVSSARLYFIISSSRDIPLR